jgi:hypothetical protein
VWLDLVPLGIVLEISESLTPSRSIKASMMTLDPTICLKALRQGIYATISPEILQILGKVSALVCAKKTAEKGDRLELGEVAGFMHWSDLQLKYDITRNLVRFANSVDHLIEEGWEVRAMTVTWERIGKAIEDPLTLRHILSKLEVC